MQVPAPFEYERATSVDHAISPAGAAGQRGPAGGRRPQPPADDEAPAGHPRVPGRHQRPARRARLHPGRAGPDPHRRHDPPPRAARVRRARRRLPDLPRRRAGHRRPGRPQPGHARRLAVPGRPVGGPLGGVHHARRQLRDPRAAAASGWSSMEEFHRGPYETAVGDGEMLTEIRIPIRAGGSSAYEKVERRAGDWAIVSAGAAVWMDGGTITDARVGPGRGRPQHHRHPGHLRRPPRPGAVRGPLRPGRRHRGRGLPARPPTCGAAPSTSATSPTS